MDLVYPVSIAPLASAGKGAREMVPVVEPTGTVIGRASRASCHSGTKLLHPVVHLHIINRFGQVYLQRRAATKTLLPLYWDTAVGGHVNYGEYLLEQTVKAGNSSFYLAHGHRHNVRNGIKDICIEASAYGCGYALFGHTHCQERGSYFGVTALNPGTVTRGDYLIIVLAGGKPEFTFKNLAD